MIEGIKDSENIIENNHENIESDGSAIPNSGKTLVGASKMQDNCGGFVGRCIPECDIPASETLRTYAYEYNYLVSGIITLIIFFLASLCFKKSKTNYIIIGIISILLGVIIYFIIKRKSFNTISYSC